MSEVCYRTLYLAQNGNCAYCGRGLAPKVHKSSCKNGWTKDHVTPKALGGHLKHGNVVLTCFGCNMMKQTLAPTEQQSNAIVEIWRAYEAIVGNNSLSQKTN